MYFVDDKSYGFYGPFSSKRSVWKFILGLIKDLDYDDYFDDEIVDAIRNNDLDFIIEHEDEILDGIAEDISYDELQAPY